MKARRIILLSLLLGSAYVAFAGCGDEETTTSSNTDAGNETSTVDSSPIDSSGGDARLDSGSPEFTGSTCNVAADCYGGLDAAALKGGEPVCIDKVTQGYCTHKCQTDQDCCAVPGECVTGLKQVCSSFSSSPDKYCFLSCEPADITAATDGGFSDAGTDGENYCRVNANAQFGCRSSGGGNENRKVCFPIGPTNDGGPNDGGDGGDAADASDAADAADADGG